MAILGAHAYLGHSCESLNGFAAWLFLSSKVPGLLARLSRNDIYKLSRCDK